MPWGSCFGGGGRRRNSLCSDESVDRFQRPLPAPPTAPRPLSSFGSFTSSIVWSTHEQFPSTDGGAAAAGPATPTGALSAPGKSQKRTTRKQQRKEKKEKKRQKQTQKQNGDGKRKLSFSSMLRRRSSSRKMKKERTSFLGIRRRGKGPPPGLRVQGGFTAAWPAENTPPEYASADDFLLSPFFPAAEEDEFLFRRQSMGAATPVRRGTPLRRGSSGGGGGHCPTAMSVESAARFASALCSTGHRGDGRRVLHLDHEYAVCTNDDDECGTPLATPAPMAAHEYAEVGDVAPVSPQTPNAYVSMTRPGTLWPGFDDHDTPVNTPPLLQDIVPTNSIRRRTSTYDSADAFAPAAAAAAAAVAAVHDYAEIAELSPTAGESSTVTKTCADYAEIDEVVQSANRLPNGAIYVGGSAPEAILAAAAAAHAAAAAAAENAYDGVVNGAIVECRPTRTGEYEEIDDVIVAAAAVATAAIGIVDLSDPRFAIMPDVHVDGGDATLTPQQFPNAAITPQHSTESDSTLEPSSPAAGAPSGKFYSSFGDQSSCKRKPHQPSSPSSRDSLHSIFGETFTSPTTDAAPPTAMPTMTPPLTRPATEAPPGTGTPAAAANLLSTTPWNVAAVESGESETIGILTDAPKLSYAAAAAGGRGPGTGDGAITKSEMRDIVSSMSDENIDKMIAGFDVARGTPSFSG